MNYLLMEKHLFILLFLGLMVSCQPIPEKTSDNSNPVFKTTADSQLFFKNVRQIFYTLESQEHTNLDIYRIKKQENNIDKPLINVAIVNNWRYDEAYIIIEPNDFFIKMDTITVVWEDKTGKNGEFRFLRQSNKEQHFQFASELYQNIKANHTLFVKNSTEKVVIFNNSQEREALQTTMKDYYRLVGLL